MGGGQSGRPLGKAVGNGAEGSSQRTTSKPERGFASLAANI